IGHSARFIGEDLREVLSDRKLQARREGNWPGIEPVQAHRGNGASRPDRGGVEIRNGLEILVCDPHALCGVARRCIEEDQGCLSGYWSWTTKLTLCRCYR